MPDNDRPRTPRYLDQADTFYKEPFDRDNTKDLSSSIADWSLLTDAERSFTIAHLLYLNLQAQAHNGRVLRETRNALEEIADELAEAVDDVLGDEGDDEAPSDEPADQTAAPQS